MISGINAESMSGRSPAQDFPVRQNAETLSGSSPAVRVMAAPAKTQNGTAIAMSIRWDYSHRRRRSRTPASQRRGGGDKMAEKDIAKIELRDGSEKRVPALGTKSKVP